MTTLHNRINELGVAEPVIAQQGADRIVVQLPGVQDTAKAKDILGRTATLEIRMVDDTPGAVEAAQAGRSTTFWHRTLCGTRRHATAGQEAGGTDRRTADRRAAGFRQPDP
jgi:preprotein translocase subunit SecD